VCCGASWFESFRDPARLPEYIAIYFQHQLGIERQLRREGVQAR